MSGSLCSGNPQIVYQIVYHNRYSSFTESIRFTRSPVSFTSDNFICAIKWLRSLYSTTDAYFFYSEIPIQNSNSIKAVADSNFYTTTSCKIAVNTVYKNLFPNYLISEYHRYDQFKDQITSDRRVNFQSRIALVKHFTALATILFILGTHLWEGCSAREEGN